MQFALRWRTEDEVVSGAGETTCGNTRCGLHSPRNIDPADGPPPPLSTLELPFAYEEKGESKFALVKVVLCARCCKKLIWKRNKDKERQKAAADAAAAGGMEEREAEVEVSVTAKYKDDEGRERVEVSEGTEVRIRRYCGVAVYLLVCTLLEILLQTASTGQGRGTKTAPSFAVPFTTPREAF